MPKLKKILTLVAIALAFPSPILICRAEIVASADAEKSSTEGDLEKLRKIFQEELNGDPPPAVIYNYGTTLAKAGVMGEAYVALLRASYASPFDGDIRQNLRFVESQIPAVTRAIRPATWLSWWPEGLRLMPWQLWMIFGLALSALALAVTRSSDRTVLVLCSVTAAAFLLLSALSLWQLRSPIFGVISAAKIKSGPGSTYSDIVSLEPGSLVNSEAVRDSWLKIRFIRGDSGLETVGWVEPSTVLKIR